MLHLSTSLPVILNGAIECRIRNILPNRIGFDPATPEWNTSHNILPAKASDGFPVGLTLTCTTWMLSAFKLIRPLCPTLHRLTDQLLLEESDERADQTSRCQSFTLTPWVTQFLLVAKERRATIPFGMRGPLHHLNIRFYLKVV